MATIYGSALTNPTADTELGLAFPQFGGNATTLQAPKGDIKTIDTIVAGSGYPLGPGGTPKVVTCVENGGTGSGATFRVTTKAGSGILRSTSSVKNTAIFDDFQNRLLLNENIGASQFRYCRVTATGAGASGRSSGVAGTSATGASATFIVTIEDGQVEAVQVANVGTGYLVGDVVTITKAALEGGLTGVTAQGDLTLLLTEDNVLGALDTVEVLNGGQGYLAGDTLTLTINEPTFIGTGTVNVATLGEAKVTSTQLRYPIALKVGEPGATIAAPKTVELKQLDGTQVIIGGLITGAVLPMTFSEITAAGTDLDLAQTTIFYK